MLSEEDILKYIEQDKSSTSKRYAKIGQKYYAAEHDILQYRLFYFNDDGELVEDKTRTNKKICHPFFTEQVDQAVQFILSGKDGYVKSDIPELQTELDAYFNENESFTSELSEVLTGVQVKGWEYMYAYKTEEGRTAFKCTDSLGIVEVKDTAGKTIHIIYYYNKTDDKTNKTTTYVQVWDEKQVYYYIKSENSGLRLDTEVKYNPRPHIIYTRDNDDHVYYDDYGVIPFFRIDNNKNKTSWLKPIKDLIDDYDIMASSLSNNLIDFDTPLHIVKGFEGDNLSELQTNLKTKKIVGVGEDGGVDVKTVDVPYEARKVKLELDEKNIYRFGMALNTDGLKDTNATTNIAIKAMYSLLELKCNKIEIQLKKLLRQIVSLVIEEINEEYQTAYQMKDVYFTFDHEILSNAQENAQIELTNAQKVQTVINTLLNIGQQLDSETLMQLICEQLDLDYDDIKDKLPKEDDDYEVVQDKLNNIVTESGDAVV